MAESYVMEPVPFKLRRQNCGDPKCQGCGVRISTLVAVPYFFGLFHRVRQVTFVVPSAVFFPEMEYLYKEFDHANS